MLIEVQGDVWLLSEIIAITLDEPTDNSPAQVDWAVPTTTLDPQ